MALDENNGHDIQRDTPRTMRIVFGVFMIFIYIGMGVLLLTGFFDSLLPIAWTRYVLAVAFIIYGIWRGYRQFSGRY